jgi:hypothetical protein
MGHKRVMAVGSGWHAIDVAQQQRRLRPYLHDSSASRPI